MKRLLRIALITGILLSSTLVSADSTKSDSQPEPTDINCSGVSPLSRFPFITIAEFAGRKNVSKEYWKHAGGFTAHRGNSIRICFDKTTLANDGRFAQGTISLAAKIGDRAVEVDGYSEVGKPQTLRSATFRPDLQSLIENFAEFRAKNTTQVTDNSEISIETARNAVLLIGALTGSPENERTFSRVIGTSPIILARHSAILRDALKSYDEMRASEEAKKARLIPAYETAVDNTVAAKDTLTSLERKRNIARTDLNGLPVDAADEDKKAARKRLDDAEGEVRTAEGKVDLALREEDRASKQLELADIESRESARAATTAVTAALRELLGTLNLRQSIAEYDNDLLRYAGGIDDAEIFLSKQDAKPGDILRLYLLHYRDATGAAQETAEEKKPQQYTLAEIYIDDYGYHRSTLDSFLLVKRLHEPTSEPNTAAAEPSDTSPSNFKGSGGVSLLWSKTARPSENVFWRVLEPSWGVNVSYLDFDNSKEIEIGTGLVAGLFQNQLHLGCGWNLNVLSHRDYCFVGFSFAAIEKKLAGKKSEVPAEPGS